MRKNPRWNPPKLEAWWQKDGDNFWVTPEALDAAIGLCHHSDEELRRHMGFGYAILSELRAGKRVSLMTAVNVQHMLCPPRSEQPPKSP